MTASPSKGACPGISEQLRDALKGAESFGEEVASRTRQRSLQRSPALSCYLSNGVRSVAGRSSAGQSPRERMPALARSGRSRSGSQQSYSPRATQAMPSNALTTECATMDAASGFYKDAATWPRPSTRMLATRPGVKPGNQQRERHKAMAEPRGVTARLPGQPLPPQPIGPAVAAFSQHPTVTTLETDAICASPFLWRRFRMPINGGTLRAVRSAAGRWVAGWVPLRTADRKPIISGPFQRPSAEIGAV